MFFTPYYYQNRGNATTARRLEHGLSDEVNINVFAYEEMAYDSSVIQCMENADVIHILQFARFVDWAEKYDLTLSKPYIVTSGGTDINHSLAEDRNRYLPFLIKAKAVSVFSNQAKSMLVKDHGLKEEFVHVIPQSVYLPETGGSEEELNLPAGSPNILLPAGLRPVKDVLFACKSIQKLKEDFPDITFLIVGANLDQNVYSQVHDATKRNSWLRYSSEVDLSTMKELYEWADIVLNTSISEGQPTSILEAMSLGKPVIARVNTGNSSIIQQHVNGMLFQTHEELYESLKKVLSDKNVYEVLVKNGYQTIVENHTIKQEIYSYLHLYKH